MRRSPMERLEASSDWSWNSYSPACFTWSVPVQLTLKLPARDGKPAQSMLPAIGWLICGSVTSATGVPVVDM